MSNNSVPDALREIKDVLRIFLNEEQFLISEDVNERSITHRLAVYFGDVELFKSWDIDCEYNRVGEHQIDEPVIAKTLNLPIDNVSSDDTEAKTVFPDIIIHKRGVVEGNFIVIEVKKFDRSIEFDKTKLTAYVKQLKYQLGISIRLGLGKASLRWTTDGNFKIEDEETLTI